MSQWTLYDIATGKIIATILDANGPLDDLKPGMFFVSGYHNQDAFYVVNGTVVPRPQLPIVYEPGDVILPAVFLIEEVPVGTEASVDGGFTFTVIDDGSVEITAEEASTVTVILRKFPYVTRTIDVNFIE